jgi:hypothetical protein
MQEMLGNSVAYDEPADWIVEQAQQQGVTLSRRKLADWHRAGLIPKPDREFLGGPDGSESIYPRGTLNQAIACSFLMKRFGSVERVGWELWMRGFLVAERHWRDPLRQAHEMFQLFFSVTTDADDEDSEGYGFEQSDAVDPLVRKVSDLSQVPSRLGVARRRLRGDRFNEVLSIVISTAIGSFEVSESAAGERNDPIHVLSRLLGVEPGRHKAAVPPSPVLSVTGRGVAENLEAMAQFLPLIRGSTSLDSITQSEFASAREELSFLVSSYLSVRQSEARIAPGSTPDLALLQQLLENLGPKEQGGLLLIWLAVRSIPGWRENLDALRRAYPRGNVDGKPERD